MQLHLQLLPPLHHLSFSLLGLQLFHQILFLLYRGGGHHDRQIQSVKILLLPRHLHPALQLQSHRFSWANCQQLPMKV